MRSSLARILPSGQTDAEVRARLEARGLDALRMRIAVVPLDHPALTWPQREAVIQAAEAIHGRQAVREAIGR